MLGVKKGVLVPTRIVLTLLMLLCTPLAQADSWTEGRDGLIVTYPTGWSWTEGEDGRRVVYPSGWRWTEGRDGRRVVCPSGWSWTEGEDGRRVVYPSGWKWTEGRDGRRVVYPSGWSWTEGQNGRRVVYATSSGGSDIIFALLHEMKLGSDLRPYSFKILEQMGHVIVTP